MANTHHTGIPKLQWVGAYPPCTPSASISVDLSPFCAGDSVMFTPTLNCVENVIIASYAWVVNGVIKSTSPYPFVTTELLNNDKVYFLFIANENTYVSNVITVVEKTEGCDPPVEPALELTFDDIANVPVADASSVSDWNTFFDLPVNGNPFTSVEVVGDMVRLIGGSGITLKDELFFAGYNLEDQYLLKIRDTSCVVTAEPGVFLFCMICNEVTLPNLLSAGDACFQEMQAIDLVFNLPSLQTAGGYCFAFVTGAPILNLPSLISADSGCFDYFGYYTLLSSINLPSCTNLGATTGDENTFGNISGQTFTLTVPSALMTCNGGNPDGDIQTLMANNTVTIITV